MSGNSELCKRFANVYFASEPNDPKAKVQTKMNQEWTSFKSGKKIDQKAVEIGIAELNAITATKKEFLKFIWGRSYGGGRGSKCSRMIAKGEESKNPNLKGHLVSKRFWVQIPSSAHFFLTLFQFIIEKLSANANKKHKTNTLFESRGSRSPFQVLSTFSISTTFCNSFRHTGP